MCKHLTSTVIYWDVDGLHFKKQRNVLQLIFYFSDVIVYVFVLHPLLFLYKGGKVRASLQTYHVYSTLKRGGNGCFHVFQRGIHMVCL